MPRTNLTSRIQNYEDKLTPERVKETFEKRRRTMLELQRNAVNELGRIENEVKSVLGEHPIVTPDYLKYHNFAREVYRAHVRFGGGYGLTHKVAKLIEKYKADECLEAALLAIRDRVFAIQAPEP